MLLQFLQPLLANDAVRIIVDDTDSGSRNAASDFSYLICNGCHEPRRVRTNADAWARPFGITGSPGRTRGVKLLVKVKEEFAECSRLPLIHREYGLAGQRD